MPHARVFLAAWRGQQAETSRLTAAGDRDATARGEGRTIGVGKYATAVLYNGLAQYEDALAAARQATEYPQDLAFFTWGLVELIEAAARCGKADLAADGAAPAVGADTHHWHRLGVGGRGPVPSAGERG